MMRLDFMPQAADYTELAEILSGHQFLVSPMDDGDLRRVIEEPARLVGSSFEYGLVDTILRDVGREPGALPLLEHALLQVWERRSPDQVMTLQAYWDSEGVQGALAKRADALFDALTPEQQTSARSIMLRLTQPGEGTEDTRRRSAINELWTRPEEQPTVEHVIEELADACLLTTSLDASGERQVDVAHEALIRGWPRLRRWIEEDRTALRTHRRITEAAQEWQRMKRDESVLFRGARLAQAKEWRERHEGDLNDPEREFLDASVARQERDAEEVRERQRRELERTQALAEEQKQRAEEQQRLAEAEQRRADAEKRRADAEKRRADAEEQRANAERQRAETEVKYSKTLRRRNRLIIGTGIVAIALAILVVRVAIVSDERRVATIARGVLNENPQLAVLLALSSEELASTDEAVDVVSKALDVYPPIVMTLSKHSSSVTSVAWSPNGRQLASGARDTSLILWDLATGRPRILRGHTGEVTSVAWSPNGNQLASGASDKSIILWDVSSGQPRATLRGHTGEVTSVAWSPDGARLASGAIDWSVRLLGARFTDHPCRWVSRNLTKAERAEYLPWYWFNHASCPK
jgi:hypothetical protein